jgi:hypothetical protein
MTARTSSVAALTTLSTHPLTQTLSFVSRHTHCDATKSPSPAPHVSLKHISSPFHSQATQTLSFCRLEMTTGPIDCFPLSPNLSRFLFYDRLLYSAYFPRIPLYTLTFFTCLHVDLAIILVVLITLSYASIFWIISASINFPHTYTLAIQSFHSTWNLSNEI